MEIRQTLVPPVLLHKQLFVVELIQRSVRVQLGSKKPIQTMSFDDIQEIIIAEVSTGRLFTFSRFDMTLRSDSKEFTAYNIPTRSKDQVLALLQGNTNAVVKDVGTVNAITIGSFFRILTKASVAHQPRSSNRERLIVFALLFTLIGFGFLLVFTSAGQNLLIKLFL